MNTACRRTQTEKGPDPMAPLPQKTILVFVPWYIPGFKAGGPIQSVANLLDGLSGDFRFRIVTGDRDFGDTGPYPGISPGKWTDLGNAQVCYLSPDQQKLRPIARLLRDTPHETLYLNSFFHLRFSTIPLLARRLGLVPERPTILAPRGEFSPGALALKARKKQAFLRISRATGLHSGLFWHASTRYEAQDIQNAMDYVARDIRVAPNLPRRHAAPKVPPPRRPGEPLRVVFLSRISPKKNLLFTLEVLARARVPIDFSIYGPNEDPQYWQRCQAAMASLPAHVSARYHGPIAPADVIATLALHDLFFLPTLGENYGHVVAEALQAGLPVLLSDQTPWRNLAAIGLGRDYPLGDTQPFVSFIEELASQEPHAAAAMRRAVIEKAAQITDMPERLRQNRNLFAQLST